MLRTRKRRLGPLHILLARVGGAGASASARFPLSSYFASNLLSLRFHLLLVCILLIHLPSPALCTAVNRTIDDSLGDSVTTKRPVFLPATLGVWEDQTCKGCAIQPDKSLAFNGTWTAATYNAGLGNISCTLSFTGTAIYVFFILANNVAPGITTVTESNFTLDGKLAGHFLHEPDNSTTAPEFLYGSNALVYSETGLKNSDHTLIISTTGVDHDVFVNFDYAMYTFQDDATTDNNTTATTTPNSTPTTSKASTSPLSPTSSVVTPPTDQSLTSPSSNTGAIVGGAVAGVVVFISALIALFLFYRRRRLRATRTLSLSGGIDGSGLNSASSGQMAQREYPSSGLGSGSRLLAPVRPGLDEDAEGSSTMLSGTLPAYMVSHTHTRSSSGPNALLLPGSSDDTSEDRIDGYTDSSLYPSATALASVSLGRESHDNTSSGHIRSTSTSTDATTSALYEDRSMLSALPTGEVMLMAGRKKKGDLGRGTGLGGGLQHPNGLSLSFRDSGGPQWTPALPSSGNLDSGFNRIAPNTTTFGSAPNGRSAAADSDLSRDTQPTSGTADASSRATPRKDLPPVPPNPKAEVRLMRQLELERQMGHIQEEMRDLQQEAEEAQAAQAAGVQRSVSVRSNRSRRRGLGMSTQRGNAQEGDGIDDVEALKNQIRMMVEQIGLLQSQLQSPWAQGLSDDPPPGYTPPDEPHR